MLPDLRLALRSLLKTPGFTAAALLTLALALGANTTVFSLLNAAVLRPLVPHHPEEVVSLFNASRGADREFRRFSLQEYQALQAPNDVFADLAAISPTRAGLSPEPGAGLQRSLVHLTSANYFSLLGTTPAQGRFYDDAEARPGANLPVAVASHALWQRLGGQPGFVGSTLWVNGQACTVIGLTRPEFSGLSALLSPELWLPLGMYSHLGSATSRASGHTDLHRPDNFSLMLTGRMQPGLGLAAARLRLPALAGQLPRGPGADAPDARELSIAPPSRFSNSAEPSDNTEVAILVTPLLFMAGSVLLIACLNLANMLLARGAARTKEIALRLALGATRWRIIQQLLVEGLVLALLGGALGLVLSVWANRAMLASLDGAIRSTSNATLSLRPELDATVLGLTFLACAAATLLFSLAPALRASRLDVVADLKSVGPAAVSGDRWNRFFAGRHLLVMAQIALSVVLLFSAGLFLRGALKAGTIPLGFEPHDSLVTVIDYPLRNSTKAETQRSLHDVLARIGALPGVSQVAISTQAPMCNTETSRRVIRADAPLSTPGMAEKTMPGTEALFSGVSPGYFAALSVPVLRGRDFTEIESRDDRAPRVTIIDATLARQLFPDGDALGQRIRYRTATTSDAAAAMEIVGIVGEHRHEFLEVEPTHWIFVPLVHALGSNTYLHTRLADARRASVVAAVATVRGELLRLDPQLPVLRHEPMHDFIHRDMSLWSAQLGAVVFGVFGVIALLLSVMGVYSVKAYAVARRTREIGIRVALGARPADILALVLKQGAQQIAFASTVGVILALLLGQALTSLLFHISPADPFALAGAIFILGSAALLACYLPARRATKVDPMVALRSE